MAGDDSTGGDFRPCQAIRAIRTPKKGRDRGGGYAASPSRSSHKAPPSCPRRATANDAHADQADAEQHE